MNKKIRVLIFFVGIVVVALLGILLRPPYNAPVESGEKSLVTTETLVATLTIVPSSTSTLTSISTSTPTSIPSPTPTATSLPATISGRLFFDINLSGTRDEIRMKYFDGLIHPGFRPQTQNADFVRALEDYTQSHPHTRDWTYIMLLEPGLSNIEVCASLKGVQQACVLTDEQGFYSLKASAIRQGDFIGLKFTDLNEGEIHKMTYQNRPVKPVTIPPYELNGISVPEQNLVQTHLMKITNIYYIEAGKGDVNIGLTQGALPYPPIKGEPYIYSFFDHDPRIGWGLDWRTRTALSPKSYNQLPNRLTDNLDGVDVGGQKGDLVVSVGFGMATIRRSENMGNQIIVMVDNFPHLITYSHLDTVLISGTQEVFAGQIIGVVGRTGKNVGAPHVHLDVGSSGYDPFGNPDGAYPQLWTRAFSPIEFQ